MTITAAQIQAGITSLNTIVAEAVTVEGQLAFLLPANVQNAFNIIKAFQPVLVSIEGDIVDVATKVEAAWNAAQPPAPSA